MALKTIKLIYRKTDLSCQITINRDSNWDKIGTNLSQDCKHKHPCSALVHNQLAVVNLVRAQDSKPLLKNLSNDSRPDTVLK